MTYKSESTTKEVAGGFSQFLSVVLIAIMMATGIFFTAKLLAWSIEKKFSEIAKIEANKITAELRDRQLTCLAKNIYYEAATEPFEGKVAVAQVTINRTQSGIFPDDICKTVYQKNIVYQKTVCQFSWYCDRASFIKPINKEVYQECMVVAKKVLLEGYRLPSLTHALYYHADYVNPGWNRERITKIGRHIFYR